MENQVDFKILPSDQFNVYSPATRSDKIITYFTLLSKLRGDILAVSSQEDPNNIVSAYYTNVGNTQTLHLVKGDGSEVTASNSFAGTVTSVDMSVPTGFAISGNPITTSGTLNVSFASGYSLPTNALQATWTTAYNRSITSAAVTGTSTKTLTLNQQDGGTVTASWTDQGLTSVGLTMPAAFNVANSPLTSNGTIAVTAAGLSSQYIRGDGQLANFPSSGGGGSAVNYYLNGSVNQGSFGGTTYYQMSRTPISGAGTNFTRTSAQGNGYVASFITDAGDPDLLNIPGGNWNLEFYFNSSSSGGAPAFYGDLYKVSASNVFTLISSGATNSEVISGGTTVDQYYTSIAVPQTTLLSTDRLAIRVYVIVDGRDITLHTEDNNFSEVITTFSTGLNALNGLTDQVQYFATGTSGTDFNISSATDTHTFNIPTASGTNRGLLSSSDWTTFNSKASDSFKTIAVSGQSDVVADSATDTLTFEAGSNIVITTDAANDKITINALGGGSGSVTSVDMTVPTGFAISGNPITTSGTLALAFASGYSLPTNASQANWNTAYNDSITAFSYNTSTGVLTLTQQDAGTLTATVTLQPFTTDNLTQGSTNLYDKVVSLTGAGTTVVTGAYPNFTITSNDQFVGTVTSVNLTAGTGIAVSGGPITTNGSITVTNNDRGSSQNIFKNIDVAGQSTIVADNNDDTLTVAAGTGITITTNATTDTLTITNNAPDQTVVLTGAGTTVITGTYPSFTITSNDQYAGTVTSVDMSVPTGFAISGNPITTSGTLALAFASGYSLPTNASQTNWDTAYNDSITAFAYNTANGVLTLTQQDAGTLTATVTLAPFTTTDLTEGTNLYFTTARARQSLSAGTGITYNNSTGVITNDAPDQVVAVTAGTGISVTGTYPNFTITNTSPSSGGTVTGSGTTNYLSKWTSASALGDSLVFDNGTNVGIGTATPTEKLVVTGAIRSTNQSNNFSTGGVSAFMDIINASKLVRIGSVTGGDTLSGSEGDVGIFTRGNEVVRITAAGNIGIGTTSPNTPLSTSRGIVINSGASNDVQIRMQNNNTGSTGSDGGLLSISNLQMYLWNYENSTLIFGTNNAERMRIASTGAIRLNAYGSGSFTGTVAYNLAVDSSGNIIETAGGVVDGSGTANYVSKWSDANTLTDSVIYDDGTNVGIGNSNPGSLLQVGNAGAAPTGLATLTLTGANTAPQIATKPGLYHRHAVGLGVFSDYAMSFQVNGSSALSDAMYITNTGNVGIGTTNPGGRLHIATPDPATNFVAIDFRNPTYGIYGKSNSISARGNTLEFTATDYNGGSVTTREVLTLRPEGNVGIGTTSPDEKLHVEGNIGFAYGSSLKALNATYSNLIQTGWNGSSDFVSIYTAGNNAVNANAKITILAGGDVGIGTTDPSAGFGGTISNVKLALRNGSVGANNGTSVLLIGGNNNHYSSITAEHIGGGLTYLAFGTSSAATNPSEKMRITAAGNVGIGTTSPTTGVGLTVKRPTGTGWIIDALNSSNTRVGGFYSTSGGNGQLYLSNNAGTETIVIDSAGNSFFNGGNVGIGTTYPASKLQVSGTGVGAPLVTITETSAAADQYSQLEFAAGNRRGYIWLGNENTSPWAGAGGLNIYTANGNMDLWTGANQRVRITNGGNVLINTTTDAGYKLDVNGTFRSQGTAYFSGNVNFSNQYRTYGLPYFEMGGGGITDEYLLLVPKYVSGTVDPYLLMGELQFQRGSTSTGNDNSVTTINIQTAYNQTNFYQFSINGATVWTSIDIISISGVQWYALKARTSGGGPYLVNQFVGNLTDSGSQMLTRVRLSDAGVSLVTANVYLPSYTNYDAQVVNGSLRANRFSNAGFLGTGQLNARNHFTSFNAGSALPATGWITAAFGDASADRIVIGQWTNGAQQAIIGGHTSNLQGWADTNYISINHNFYSNGDWSVAPTMTLKSNGNLLIGTTTDNGDKLQVSGNTTINGSLYLRGGSRYIVGDGGDLFIDTENVAGRDLLLQTQSGQNVGIGTTAPAYKLEVDVTDSTAYSSSNTLAAGTPLWIYNNSATSGVASTLRLDAGQSGGNGAATISSVHVGSGSSALTFGTRNSGSNVTERVRIDNAGNVGIGTTAPQERLHVETSSEYQITWVRTGAGKRWALGTDTNGTYFTNRTDSVLPVYITNTGNVGIGTTAPVTPLQVVSATNAVDVLRIGNTAGNSGSVQAITHLAINHFNAGTNPSTRITAYQDGLSGWPGGMYFSTRSVNTDSAPVERMRITSGGLVGIGTSFPSHILHITDVMRMDNVSAYSPNLSSTSSPKFGYGDVSNDRYLAEPVIWFKINVDGTEYVIPGYTEVI